MRLLGDQYVYGRGRPIDLAVAYDWYLQAAENGDTESMIAVGDMLRYGQSVDRDLSAAIAWYENAGDLGDANAMTRLAWLYDNGIGVARHTSYAATLKRRAEPRLLAMATEGDTRALVSLADLYFSSREPCCEDERRGIEFARLAAERGHDEGQRLYGLALINSTAIERDESQGLYWLQESVDQGNPVARADLATMYLLGVGIDENRVEAYRLARDIEEFRTMTGNLVIGDCFVAGDCGVRRDGALLRAIVGAGPLSRRGQRH